MIYIIGMTYLIVMNPNIAIQIVSRRIRLYNNRFSYENNNFLTILLLLPY